jgi:SAM-dependent methyltransferase
MTPDAGEESLKPVPDPLDPSSPEFSARRVEARKALDAIDPFMKGDMQDPLRRGWFEAVYALAEDDPARVPWANLSAHPLTRTWIGLQGRGVEGLSVLDIGCGLGDNAECFAAHGARVTAFDFVPEAVAWAKRRFPETSVDYRTADLFALPAAWQGQFDLVHECYTLQALSFELLPRALGIFKTLLKPRGRLLIVARGRAEDEKISGPPWPLPPSFFHEAEPQGLRCLALEDITATAEVSRRHWRALLGPASV